MMIDRPLNFCISQATTMPATFSEDLEAYAGVGWRATEVWLTKLEKHLEKASIEDTQNLIRDKQLSLIAASYQGGLLLSQGRERQVHFDHFKRRLELCQTFGIKTLNIAADFTQKVDGTALGRAIVSLKQACQWAAAFDVRIAMEFRGSEAFCNNLSTAIDLVNECAEPNAAICLDWFHFYKGPSKVEDLSRLTKENLAHVQICDIAGIPRELMADSDRVFPKDGDFDFAPLIRRLRDIGYEDYISLEVLNPVLWQMKLTQVAELGLMASERIATS